MNICEVFREFPEITLCARLDKQWKTRGCGIKRGLSAEITSVNNTAAAIIDRDNNNNK